MKRFAAVSLTLALAGCAISYGERASGFLNSQLADAYIATHRPGWKSKKHADQWEMTLGDTYCAALRKIAVDKITRTDVLEVAATDLVDQGRDREPHQGPN